MRRTILASWINADKIARDYYYRKWRIIAARQEGVDTLLMPLYYLHDRTAGTMRPLIDYKRAREASQLTARARARLKAGASLSFIAR